MGWVIFLLALMLVIVTAAWLQISYQLGKISEAMLMQLIYLRQEVIQGLGITRDGEFISGGHLSDLRDYAKWRRSLDEAEEKRRLGL